MTRGTYQASGGAGQLFGAPFKGRQVYYETGRILQHESAKIGFAGQFDDDSGFTWMSSYT
jgi:hypothetical protein